LRFAWRNAQGKIGNVFIRLRQTLASIEVRIGLTSFHEPDFSALTFEQRKKWHLPKAVQKPQQRLKRCRGLPGATSIPTFSNFISPPANFSFRVSQNVNALKL
jgi:hypothetical protein